MAVQTTGTARGRSGREAKKAERAKIAPGPAYITRKIPDYEMLSEEGLAQFDIHADKILKEIGMEFRGDEVALKLFREAGADVQGSRIRFEPGHVRALCKTAPDVFTQHARNPARSSLPGAATSAIDFSSSRTRLYISGAAAADVLLKGIPVDLAPDAFAIGHVALTGVHHTPILLHRTATDRFEIYAMRSFALTVFEWLTDAALEHGYRVRHVESASL
jgi:heterotetrameric sarcosine oxidase gamma subunit